jgi:hypothetical protein
MNRDDIIRLAREAGIYYRDIEDEFCEADKDGVPLEMMVKFTALVAAAERERMKSEGWRQCAAGQRTTQYCDLLELAVANEREACAKFLIDLYESDGGYHPAEEFAKNAAAAIRARGNE